MSMESEIREWHERMFAAEETMARIDGALCLIPESPLHESFWALCGGYIAALDNHYSIGGWLEWWWNECRLGDHPMKAALPGEELREIKTIDDFVRLISDAENMEPTVVCRDGNERW